MKRGKIRWVILQFYLLRAHFPYSERCIHCGECVDRCVFGARVFRDEKMEYDADVCPGCGLCVTRCPVEAISMELRETK
ncbi:MAG: 4Fe-4S dicluster domain-containing protein [Desulfobacteraceae bacterium]|nr:MAG: 4Fe-4S dicluster domain-containing protein [Desulfobacteraceae bacterium]